MNPTSAFIQLFRLAYFLFLLAIFELNLTLTKLPHSISCDLTARKETGFRHKQKFGFEVSVSWISVHQSHHRHLRTYTPNTDTTSFPGSFPSKCKRKKAFGTRLISEQHCRCFRTLGIKSSQRIFVSPLVVSSQSHHRKCYYSIIRSSKRKLTKHFGRAAAKRAGNTTVNIHFLK